MSISIIQQALFPIVAISGVGGLFLLFALPLTVFLVFKGYQSVSRYLLMEHTPTSKCGGVSPGLVELKAEVAEEGSVASPLTDEQVVYVDYTVEEQVRDSSNDTAWEVLSQGTDKRYFYLHDESGRVRVDPSDAEIHPHLAVDQTCGTVNPLFRRGPERRAPNSTGKRRFREEHIAVGQEVYLIGTARARQDLAVPEIGSDNTQPFIISTRDESHLVVLHKRRAGCQLFLGALLAISIPPLVTMAVDGVSFAEALQIAIVPTFTIGLGVIGLIWTLYRMKHSQHLEDLKRRVDRALSILRRECEHRERLVTAIASRVADAGDEGQRELLNDLIDERRRRSFTGGRTPTVSRVCSTIDEQSDALEEIFSVAKNCGGLDNDSTFRDLLEELTRCEKQIMMSRNFYNEGIRLIDREPESATGDLSYSSKAENTAFTFKPFERKPIDIVLPEDPQGEYAADFERESERVIVSVPDDAPDVPDASNTTDQIPAASETREMHVPQTIDDPNDAQPPPVPDAPQTRESMRALEAFDDLDGLEDDGLSTVTMRFGSSVDFGESQGFGEIGRFGESRTFDELSKGSTRKPSKERPHFGFSAEDRRSLLDRKLDEE